jgi:hypothetical protein
VTKPRHIKDIRSNLACALEDHARTLRALNDAHPADVAHLRAWSDYTLWSIKRLREELADATSSCVSAESVT